MTSMFNAQVAPRGAHHAAWQRWEMARFDMPEPTPAPAAIDDTTETLDAVALRLQVEADIEHRQRQAEERGYAQGYAAGHTDGLNQGERAGHAEGLRRGHEEGLQTGFQSGFEQGHAQAEQHAQQLQTLAQACADALGTLEHTVGQALVQLATSIAERVVHSTLTVHPEKILEIVCDIVRMHGDHDAVLTLRVHPDDHARVQDYLSEDGVLKRWRVVADTSVQAGGCQAETALGAVDATLQTRWRKALGVIGIDALTRPAMALESDAAHNV